MGRTLPGTALITGGKTAEDDAGQQGRDAAAPLATSWVLDTRNWKTFKKNSICREVQRKVF